ncbi:malonyl-ACP O-methyltransferase BioC [Cellvibrio sp. NN19]|uniref:malonyl-ACP O-methyltransferase BioC n=1 Tax=Cellvibrio chitinivorans TaxID=3102792 RepID=UPI002B411CE8|nr:malonyl-ACP O-methyltransferase BioC [Cellvibrio sp. NN19]
MVNLVLIHGWGCDSRTWQPLLEMLQKIASVTLIDLPGFGASAPLSEFSLDAVLEQIAAQLPQNAVVMGWSLGGMLAVQLAARFPERVEAVITLAANLKFVASPDYPTAMLRAINRQFNQGFAQDPQATLKLFGGLLAQGDANERSLLKQLRRNETGEITDNWLQALQLLSMLDNREAFAQLHQPGLHLFAEKDALVPIAAVNALTEINPQQETLVLENTAHALHWSQPQLVVDAVNRFLNSRALTKMTASSDLDKQKVAQSFSRAAATYDSVAQLQRDIGAQLSEGLPTELPENSVVLDLGSGTGYFTRQLSACYQSSQVIGLDIAEGMLNYAASQQASASWLCADAESLPLADNSIDIIFSSLAIQWCSNLAQLMKELARVLKPDGKIYIATLGPKTLHELKAAWQQVDDYVHVNQFQSVQQLTDALDQASFSQRQIQQENRTLYYEQLNELTRELKSLGAHNVNAGKPDGLTGRARVLAFKNAYESFRALQGLPATYDVIYITAHKEAAQKSYG